MFSLADQERAYSIHLKAETKEARKKAYVEAFEKAFKEGYIEMYGPVLTMTRKNWLSWQKNVHMKQ